MYDGGGRREARVSFIPRHEGGLIRLPADNVRLVCDPWLQPGILSIEARDDAPGGDGGDGAAIVDRRGRGGGGTAIRNVTKSMAAVARGRDADATTSIDDDDDDAIVAAVVISAIRPWTTCLVVDARWRTCSP